MTLVFAYKKKKIFDQVTETFKSAAEISTLTAPDAVTVVEVCEADSSSSESEAQSQSLPVTLSTQPPPQMKKKKACFLDEWAKTWPWAEDSSTELRCKLFVKYRKSHKLAEGSGSGCTNYKTTTLKRHAECKGTMDQTLSTY